MLVSAARVWQWPDQPKTKLELPGCEHVIILVQGIKGVRVALACALLLCVVVLSLYRPLAPAFLS